MGAGCPPSTPLGVGASYRSPQVGNGYGLRRSPSAHQTPERVGASSPVTSMGNGCGILLSSPATLAGERCRLRSGPPSERWASGGSGRALLSTESSYPCRVALFYPRPLRPARGSAPRRSAPAARKPAARKHPPAADRSPLPQQARPPRLPPSSPNERTCEHKTEHAGPPTAKSLPGWCEQEPWPPPSCRHPLSPHPRPLAVKDLDPRKNGVGRKGNGSPSGIRPSNTTTVSSPIGQRS